MAGFAVVCVSAGAYNAAFAASHGTATVTLNSLVAPTGQATPSGQAAAKHAAQTQVSRSQARPTVSATAFETSSVAASPTPTAAASSSVTPVATASPVTSQVTPPPSVTSASPAQAQAIAHSQLATYGWSQAQWPCLQKLWTQESSWMTTAENPSSGAYGIPQSLPANKMASVAGDWRTNTRTQITWGLQYIQGAYGSPCGAWAHEVKVNWY